MNQYQNIALGFLSYDQIVLVYTGTYAKIYGQAKATSIFERVVTSNKISGLISRSKFSRRAITPLDILHTLNSIPYFMFAKPETLSYAGLMVMARWKKEVNEDLFLLDDFELKTNATILIEKAMGLPFIFGDPLAKQAISDILEEKLNDTTIEEEERNEKQIETTKKEEEKKLREENAIRMQEKARQAYMLLIDADSNKAKILNEKVDKTDFNIMTKALANGNTNQKIAVVNLLFGVAKSDAHSELDKKELAFLNNTMKCFDLTTEQCMEKFYTHGVDTMIQDLNTLSFTQKEILCGLTTELIVIDSKTNETEMAYINTVMKKLGFTPETYLQSVKKVLSAKTKLGYN